MIQQTEILGAHAWFFRDGLACTLPAVGVASRSNLPTIPSATDAAVGDPAWTNLGILDATISASKKSKDIWAPNPGSKVLNDSIPYMRELSIKLKKTELSNLDLELLYGTSVMPDSPTAGGTLDLLGLGGNNVKGFIHLSYYGRNNTRLQAITAFCIFDYDGDFSPADDAVETGIVARLIKSALNKGIFL